MVLYNENYVGIFMVIEEKTKVYISLIVFGLYIISESEERYEKTAIR